MSNSLAIATVTATLHRLVLGAITTSKDVLIGGTEVEVTTGRPSPDGIGVTKKGVNIYLYQVSPNAALRNADLPTRRAEGTAAQRPQLALDLHYLLSFFGNEAHWEPQRLLGTVMTTLHAQPVLSREMIVKTINSVSLSLNFEFLKGSDLGDAVERVRFTLEPFSMEEISKLWSIFFQTQYHLSVGYRASVVLLDANEPVELALPVRARNVYALPVTPPSIERVRTAGVDVPIVAATTIAVTGQRLWGDVTRLIIDGGEPIVPAADTLSDTEIRLDLAALPAPLAAGVHGIKVAHLVMMGDPPLPHAGVESNLGPFVVHPRITSLTKGALVTTTKDGVTTHATTLTLTFSPDVGRAQRAVISLNPASLAGAPRGYSFTAARRPDGSTDPEATSTIAFEVTGVATGSYVVRAQVDGADSALLGPSEAYLTVSLP